MIANMEVPIKFRVYKDVQESRGKLVGDRYNTYEPTEGYVYIFRELRKSESAYTGFASVKLHARANMKEVPKHSLFENVNREVNHYFFAYSRFILPEERIQAILEDVKAFIIERTSQTGGYVRANHPDAHYSPVICRASYVPLTLEAVNSKYLYDKGEDNKDVVFLRHEGSKATIINLFDWYGYLEEYAEKYQEKLKDYHSFMDEKVTLSDYNTHSVYKTHSTGVPDLMKDYDKDTFKFKDLYPLTDMINQRVGLDGKKMAKLRCHPGVPVDYNYPITSMFTMREEPVYRTEIQNVPVYKDFLQQYSKKMNEPPRVSRRADYVSPALNGRTVEPL